MTRISLLGQPAAEVAGTRVPGIERNPKKLAVLAYLALQPADKYATREKLLALFWPESTERAARHALSQSLHFIRQQFGGDSVLTSGPHLLRLNAQAVTVDVREFARAFDAGDWQGAAQAYGGELLDGLTVDGSAEAADWLDRERQSLRGRAAHAFWQTAAQLLRAGNAPDALRGAQRAIACDPTREPDCRVFLSEAEKRNQIALARAVASGFAAALERATDGDRPSPAFQAIVERLQTDAQMPLLEPRPADREDPVPTVVEGERPRRRWLKTAAIVTTAAAVTVSAIRSVTVRPTLGATDHAVATEFVIAPIQATGALRSVADAVTDLIAEDLSRFGWRVVLAGPKARAPAIGYSLEARASENAGHTEFSYHVRAVPSNSIVTSGLVHFTAPVEPNEVATQLTLKIRREIGRSQRVLGALSARERAQWDHVWRLHKLADSLRNAGALDHATSTYRTADSYYRTASWPAKMAVLVGVQHTRLLESFAMASYLRGDARTADSLFSTAIGIADRLMQRHRERVEPIEARASLRYLRSMFTPRPTLAMLEEAARDLRMLVAQPGASAAAYARLSGVLVRQGEYEAARTFALEAEERDVFLTSDNEILVQLFQSTFNLGDDQRAQESCDDLNERFPKEWPSAACRLLLMGWSESSPLDLEQAAAIVRAGAAREIESTRKVMTRRLELLYAGVLVRAGQPDRARRILGRIDHTADDELLALKAAVYALLGDTTEARTLAVTFASRNETSQVQIEHGRLYRGLSARALD